MKSKASIDGHPIHPMLVGFPVAFFSATLLFDAIWLFTNNDIHWQIAKYMEMLGIISSLAAAIPGLIDYFTMVPPDSSGHKRATNHMLLNFTMVFIYIVALVLRKKEGIPVIAVMGLEVIGYVIISISGWMGGTMVYRNQFAVFNRYANKGFWNEVRLGEQTGKIEIPAASELKLDQMKLVHIGRKRIVVGRTENGFAAFDDRCTHRGGSLAGGVMICGTVQCPWHGSQFDVKTGDIKAGPATENIKAYPVSEEGDKVYVTL